MIDGFECVHDDTDGRIYNLYHEWVPVTFFFVPVYYVCENCAAKLSRRDFIKKNYVVYKPGVDYGKKHED